MPIKPENRKRYPANWKDIRKDILKRAVTNVSFVESKLCYPRKWLKSCPDNALSHNTGKLRIT